MRRLKAGGAGALDTLMDRHATAVLNFCANYTGDRGWAEDIAQDSFATVFRKRLTYHEEARFLPWLYAIARNRCIDFMRRRGRALPDPAGPGSDPHSDLVAEERGEQVRRALRTLPEKFRLPLIFCEVEDMAYEDAARITGCSVKTLSSRLARARVKFKEALSELARSD